VCDINSHMTISRTVHVFLCFVAEYKWNKLDLTYRFLGYTPDLPQETVRKVFQAGGIPGKAFICIVLIRRFSNGTF